MADATSSAVEQLKALLLSGDREKIRQLEQELEKLRLSLSDKDALLETLDPVIAESLARKVIEEPQEIAGAIAPVIGPAIKQQIKSAKEDIVDALYPVIGQSIRKAVAEAMKNLARTVNEKLDSALSFRLFRKRIEARLKGVSPEEAVLKEVLPFRIEEIFYIHKQSGILLAHSSAQKHEESAKDVISGMLTAIKNFAQDALGGEYAQDLNLIEYDDFRIYLENGRYAFLAVVISGIPSDSFYQQMKALEARLHKQFAGRMREFDGRVEDFQSAESLLSTTIREFLPETEHKPPVRRWVKISFVGAMLIILLALFWFLAFRSGGKSLPPSAEHPFSREQLVAKLQHNLGASLLTPLDKLKFIWQNGVLYLQGKTVNEGERLLIAQEVSRLSSAPVVVNQMNTYSQDSTLLPVKEVQIYFPQKTAQLNAAAKAQLDSLLPLLHKLNYKQILIDGFSDSLGSTQVNYKISFKRALNVRSYLLSRGIDAASVLVSGKGALEPQAPNTSEKQRALNRRVRIRILAKAKR